MGYRLEVESADTGEWRYYGSKLYGYVNDEEQLASYKYLQKIGKINHDEFYPIWTYGCDNEMRLTKEEFAEFAKLYEQDARTFLTPYRREIGYDETWSWSDVSSTCFNGVNNMAELIESDGDKIISWG